MPERPPPDQALSDIGDEVRRLLDGVRGGEATREDFDVLIARLRGVQEDAFGPRPRAKRGEGAKWQMLRYLQDHVASPVRGSELAAVAGISEWARRIRELRVEHGYDIREVADSIYVLQTLNINEERQRQWRLANGIRRRPGSASSRIAALFEATVGEIVIIDQIAYVAKIKTAARRVRELRDEKGWPINSHIDEPALRVGEYRLLSTDPADRLDPLQRVYSDELRQEVFERDNYTCQACGRDRAAAEAAGDTRFYLEVHHKTALADELARLTQEELNRLDNLVTLCHSDHRWETAQLQKRRRRRRER